MTDFERQVLGGLARCGIAADAVCAERPLGVAVSGGADSVSLLRALLAAFGAERLRVITVDHNLREKEASAGDAQFVAALCARSGVPCTAVVFARGDVLREADRRGRGVEEAARFLRYRAFDDFIAREKLIALCLAHNQNDMLETLLMRFLQGSGAEGGFGIARRRGDIVRPLLDVSRTDIESYLRRLGQEWRTDATNDDTRYLRNQIRKKLLPLLDESFVGWKTAVMCGAEKSFDDHAALQAQADAYSWTRDGDTLWMSAAAFFAEPRAVRRRMLFTAFNQCGGAERFSYRVVRTVLGWSADEKHAVCASGREISVGSGKIMVKNRQNKATESGFLAILNDGGAVHVMRSVQNGDRIRMKDGTMKSVRDVFGDWHVRREDRARIPLVQDVSLPGQPIVALLGAELGYSDWIVT
ncbi:MAG: tRNA lysidine(34) synthetase TilS [Treponemataceae bacterium]|nr:tRNA lysidine(34) synthetase TilS [Treponemataceae bacterium]